MLYPYKFPCCSSFYFLMAMLIVSPKAISQIPPNIHWDKLDYPETLYGWKEGMEVPNLIFLDINLNAIELDDLLAEKPVLLDFWFMACPPCLENNRWLKKLYRKGKFHLVSISIDDNLAALKAFLKKEKLPWIHIRDNLPYPNRFKNSIGLGSYYPDYLLIGRNGILIRRWQENFNPASLKQAIKQSP